MELVIVAQGLPFGPDTIDHRSLGGSETAALMMAKEMRKLDHLVTVFCNLPPKGHPDFIENGAQDNLGIRWVSLEQYPTFIANTEIDLLVVSRNPDLFQPPHQAKKAVLWCHDLATYKGFLPRLMNASWNFDEVWCVSEYHKKQLHEVTGYPLKNIRVTRNGIVKFDSLVSVPREEKTLLYSARPERGLEYLVKPGTGIMCKLPDFKLRVTMYENYPDHMMEYYRQLWAWCDALPNVEMLGPKTQLQLRQLMRSSWAYIYPTAFEEVSCILAREAIEQGLPFICTEIGALKETLGDCGTYYQCDRKDIGSEPFCEDFAKMVQGCHDSEMLVRAREEMSKRKDLYWDEVAKEWENWSLPKEPNTYSLVNSLIQESDIIPAIAVLESITGEKSEGLQWLSDQIRTMYPFLYGDITMEKHYQGIYDFEEKKNVIERQEMRTLKWHPRYKEIAQQIDLIPDGSDILEYGCAEGPVILQLAQDFPNKKFWGMDFVEDNALLCEKYAKQNNIRNVKFATGSTNNWPENWIGIKFHAAIIAEVLEHTVEPWSVTSDVERHVEIGGRIIITVPQGPWEWKGLKGPQWTWRAHIWHVSKWMLRKMFSDKNGCLLSNLTEGLDHDGRACGHLIMSFTADQQLAHPIDPLEKAKNHRARQTLAACMITMNDDDKVLRCLNSIHNDIEQLQIAIGPSTDHTRQYIETWAEEHPWVEMRIKNVEKIEAKKFGFDDARNASIEGIESDWILWIDSDEYLSGKNLRLFTRNNCFDSYAIHQHHFTCDPRGEPAQLDKPARLIRNDIGFKFFGKVHEHAEMGFNGGPGFVMVLPSIDIGHTGYINDQVRRVRFDRNFPLLQWDQEVYPDRKLGRYLWLRDILHRLRMFHSTGNVQEARRLAEEAIDFFNSHVRDFEAVGGGNIAGNSALAFYSEAMQYLGRGFPIGVQVQIEEQTAQYQGIFESAEEAVGLATKALTEELRKRKSGYWA